MSDTDIIETYLQSPTATEKLDIIFELNLRAFGHLPGGKVAELAKWLNIYKQQNQELRDEVVQLKKQLTKERKRATFYLNTSDKYRDEVARLMGKKIKNFNSN